MLFRSNQDLTSKFFTRFRHLKLQKVALKTTPFSTKVQKLKFLEYEGTIMRNIVKTFQILVCNIFGDIVITQVFLEVVEKESILEVTTSQPSDTESSQSASRESSLFMIYLCS